MMTEVLERLLEQAQKARASFVSEAMADRRNRTALAEAEHHLHACLERLRTHIGDYYLDP